MARTLRFKIGDRVLAKNNAQWREAVITDLWTMMEGVGFATYVMRPVDEDRDLYTTVDSTHTVRAYVEPGLPRVIQAVQCGSSWENVQAMMVAHSMDVSLIGASLLLHAATAGHQEVLIELICSYGVPESTCDKDGRNILHIALLHKRFALVDLISRFYQKLFTKADSKGFNSIHYIVMSKNTELMRKVLYDTAYFDEIQHLSIVHLVDLHGARFGKDINLPNSTITPLDWAKRMKLTEMADILQTYMHELRIECLLQRIELLDEWNAETTFSKLRAVSDQMKQVGLPNLLSLHQLIPLLLQIGDACSQRGSLTTLRYLLETFMSPLQVSDPEKYKMCLEWLISAAISGPPCQKFPSLTQRTMIKKNTRPN